MATWNAGWDALFETLASLRPDDLTATVHIRAEAMTAIAAMHRAVAHISQHVGQIVLLAKHYRSSSWNTLSIPRGRSAEANLKTSSSSASHR
jgi:formylmethanofuran dehydrogenase subunit D